MCCGSGICGSTAAAEDCWRRVPIGNIAKTCSQEGLLLTHKSPKRAWRGPWVMWGPFVRF
jgi:hypothetical protein